MAIANRTLANAQLLAAKYDATALQLSDVANELANYDVVISSTASSLPVLGKGAVEAAIKKRKRKPIFMVDIAVPRDIESEVAELPDVYLYTIDDLSNIVQVNIEQRQQAARGAEVIVDMGSERYERERRIQSDKAILTQLRDQAEQTACLNSKKHGRLEKTGDAEGDDAVKQELNQQTHSSSDCCTPISQRRWQDRPSINYARFINCNPILPQIQRKVLTIHRITAPNMELSASMVAKLGDLNDRFEEVSALLSDAETMADREKFTALSKEFAEIEPVVLCYQKVTVLKDSLEENTLLLDDEDPDLRELAEQEIAEAKDQMSVLFAQLQTLLLPRDPNDQSNVFLEIRAGTGGDEAAIFSGDLFRMYSKFAESKGWRVEIMSERPGEHGGFKEIITRIEGKEVYSQLKFESGAHRVQRVPETESQGRVHTSACTVAIMPEVDEIDSIDIDKKDIREDTFRASGAGGQHVNKTDSAIRLTHLPTGTVVECQDERSQHKNRARALSLLQARLLDAAQSKQQSEQAENRRQLVGSGDRSERIRTYNFPQGRVTDHRINLTLYKLDEVIEGNLDALVQPLVQEHQADQLQNLAEE